MGRFDPMASNGWLPLKCIAITVRSVTIIARAVERRPCVTPWVEAIRRLLKNVNLDYPNARSVIRPAQNRGVRPGRRIREEKGGFGVV